MPCKAITRLLNCFSWTSSKTALVDTTPEEEDTVDRAPDVFAIGFEEIVDLNATNIVQNTQWSENAASWGKELQKVNRTSVSFNNIVCSLGIHRCCIV